MKKLSFLVPLVLCAFSAPVHANLCDGALVSTAETIREIHFYQQLFPDKTHRGNDAWNAIVLRCNRQRDTKGNEVAGVTAVDGGNAGKSQLQAASLEPKVIRGVYEFLGHVPIVSAAAHAVAGYKYVYVLSKEKGVWTMIIPYSAIINDIVPVFRFQQLLRCWHRSHEEPVRGTEGRRRSLRPGRGRSLMPERSLQPGSLLYAQERRDGRGLLLR